MSFLNQPTPPHFDDDSEENVEKIHLMGLHWWEEFGETALKFIED